MLELYTFLGLSILHLVVAQISRTGWTVTADSFQPGNEPASVLDGNTTTFWHTAYSQVDASVDASLPHNITINMQKLHYVNGLSYLPRQVGNLNGNIGQHKVQLSTDGVNWIAPVAFGTYLDDRSAKKTHFTTAPAQFVRLIAHTEAGGRGPWTSAAEINVFAAPSYTPPSTSLGQWSVTIDFPIIPVAAAVLHDTGKVLVWSSYAPGTYTGGSGGMTQTATYDPASGIVSQRTVTNTQHDMFCPGLSMDATGRPFVTGGNDADRTSIYDPKSDTWIAGPGMRIARGYQSSATLSDGRIFTIGGSWSGGEGNKTGEIYNPTANKWTLLPGCPVAPMLTNDAQGIYRQDNHGWLFGWKNCSVFQAGPSKAMNWYGTTGTGSQQPAGLRGSDTDAMNGNAVMYDAVNGKILTVGGSESYQKSNATTNAHIITIGGRNSTVSVATINNMNHARSFANGVVLPNGQVFIVGGQSYAMPFSDDTATLIPEIWDPVTLKFTTMNPMAIPRTYHSVALLLPDATVISGGGGLCANCLTNHFDAQIFRPPYLFNSKGAPATQPKITAISSTSIKVGTTIAVKVDSAVTSFSLIRGGSATHTVDTDQRRIPLTPLVSGTRYVMTIPNDPGIVLPGQWMLFAIDAAGVPSVARTVLIRD